MSEPAPPQRRRILWKLFLLFCAFSLVAFGLLGWYVTTDSFQQKVRLRVIAQVEKLTGGRVELGEFHTIPFRLRVDVRNLTIHGKESAGEVPFLRIDRLEAEMKIISLLSTNIGLHSLVLQHPVAHVIVYPDGSTNVPEPKTSDSSDLSAALGRSQEQGPVEQLMSLSVSRIDVKQGELLWDDQKLPLNFSAKDMELGLRYSLLRRQYEAHVKVASVDTKVQQYPSFVWRADAALILSRGKAEITSLTVTSGKSEIHFVGGLQDFHDPQITGTYHATADFGEIAALARQPQFRKGTAQFDGKGSWSSAGLFSSGNCVG